MQPSFPFDAVEVQQSTLEQPGANATLVPDTRSPEKPSFRGKRVLPSLYTLQKRVSLLRELRQTFYLAEMPLFHLTPHICVASLPEQAFATIVFLFHNRNWLDETQSCESASAWAVLSRGTASNRLFVSEMSLGEFFVLPA